MRVYLVSLLFFIFGCYSIQIEPTKQENIEVIFCEIDEDFYPYFRNQIIEKDMGVKIDYRTIENSKGIFLGIGSNSFRSYKRYFVFQLNNDEKIYIEDHIVHMSNNNKIGLDFVVEVEKYEELKRMIGKTIWLNRSSSGFRHHIIGNDGSSFNRFEEVKITSIKTYYNGDGDGLWLGIEGENGKKGQLIYYEDKSYYTENPLKEEWGEELIEIIKKERIRLGMTKEQVMVSWGKIPWDISKSVSVFGSIEIWKYRRNGDYYYVTFHNNIVTSIDQY